MPRTLESVGQHISWRARRRNGTVKCAVSIVRVRGGVQGQAPHAASLVASATAAAPEAAGPSHGRLLAKRVASHGKLLVIASVEAVD
jgi:hypothetical protein